MIWSFNDRKKRQLAGPKSPFADDGADCEFAVKDLPGFVSIKDSSVEDAVKFECDIVGSNGTLARYLNGRFLEALDIGNAINEGY